MDSSVAGKAHTLPPIDGWSRPPAAAGATLVAPVQSVRPSPESRRLRDKRKDQPDSPASLAAAPADDPLPPDPAPPAVDPETAQVFWQGPEASLSSPDPLLPAAPAPRGAAARLDGRLVRQAYGNLDDDGAESPRISRTA